MRLALGLIIVIITDDLLIVTMAITTIILIRIIIVLSLLRFDCDTPWPNPWLLHMSAHVRC